MKQINDQYEQESLECELSHLLQEQREEELILFI